MIDHIVNFIQKVIIIQFQDSIIKQNVNNTKIIVIYKLNHQQDITILGEDHFIIELHGINKHHMEIRN